MKLRSNWAYTTGQNIHSSAAARLPGEGKFRARDRKGACTLTVYGTYDDAAARRDLQPLRVVAPVNDKALRTLRSKAGAHMSKHRSAHAVIAYDCGGQSIPLFECARGKCREVGKIPDRKGKRGLRGTAFTAKDADCKIHVATMHGRSYIPLDVFPMSTAGHQRASRALTQARKRAPNARLFMSCTDDNPVPIEALAGVGKKGKKGVRGLGGTRDIHNYWYAAGEYVADDNEMARATVALVHAVDALRVALGGTNRGWEE